MIKNVTAFLLIQLTMFFSVAIHAQHTEMPDGSIFWKISGKDLPAPSYILGTHHLANVVYADSISGLRDALGEVSQVIGDVDMTDQAELQIKIQLEALILLKALMPEGVTYADLLSADDYEKLDRGLTDMMKVGLNQLGMLQPSMIAMLYRITEYSKTVSDFNPDKHESIDVYIQRVATEQDKPVLVFETIEDQINVMFGLEPLKDQAESLVCAVSHPEYSSEVLRRLNDYYATAQLQKIYDLSFNNPDDPCKMSEAKKDAVNGNRNRNWLERLPKLMHDNASLVVVGVLHLAGEEGLLYGLREMGYTVEAVK